MCSSYLPEELLSIAVADRVGGNSWKRLELCLIPSVSARCKKGKILVFFAPDRGFVDVLRPESF